ncbi:ATP-binding protein [Pseudohaliea rubra]|uniref:histidine kinase n=1 Tax=Pseudohaliea rubra DSM 19751 TaxID=1265313 RepID=A0A095WV84_9GAMM|nr:ATP-binding protein [Pseudohaliea rubra]KGE02569.1 Sensor histidine kinase PrrB (RegB) [Pseudohaliea rubra DSM 19751]
MLSPHADPEVYRASLANLRSLLAIRAIALLGQAGVFLWVLLWSHGTPSLAGFGIGLSGLAVFTLATLWRSRQPWPVTDFEFFGQLLGDVGIWSTLMYFSGGADNPFISYYIVPVVVSAAVLPWRYTWLVTGASLIAYSTLLFIYVPFPLFSPHASPDHGAGGNMHTLGMWFNFLFSAGLITYFVVRMAAILRAQADRDAKQREDRLRNDQIMAVASLAAGTAHELATPLATMTVTVDELLADPALTTGARADCEVLRDQLATCRSTLRELSSTAELTSATRPRRQALDRFARETLERWAVRRPTVRHSFDTQGGAAPAVLTEPTLAQALENLLNNAADSGGDRVDVSAHWDEREGRITVRDNGPGLPRELLADPGKPVLLASPRGLGIGLMLSHAAVERHGGRIELRNVEGGSEARLLLPLAPGEGREQP